MVDQQQTLTTSEMLEYVREHTGRITTPHKNVLIRWQNKGYIAAHTIGSGHGMQNTYLLSDVQLLCERINSNYWRKQGQASRVYPKKCTTLEED